MTMAKPGVKGAAGVATDIKCEKCGGTMMLRTSETGAFLGCSNFPRCRNLRPAPPGMAPAKPARDEAEGFQVPFFLGPDDRYPRPLFWALLILMVLDVVLAVSPFLTLLHGKPDQEYYARRLVGHLVAMALPGIFLVPVLLGYPIVALFWGALKFICLGTVVLGAVGASLANVPVDVNGTVMWGLWHGTCLIVAVWYFWMRKDG